MKSCDPRSAIICRIEQRYEHGMQIPITSPPGINENVLKILGNKADEKRSQGDELICSLVLDEMAIHQHAQWCDKTKTIIGYPTYGRKHDENVLAKEAIVFMLIGVNERLQSAIAYHFLSSLNGKERSDLLKMVIESILKHGIRLLNVTSDGLPANQPMYEALGANLDHLSPTFQPFVCLSEQKIYVIKDPPHIHKLVRNTLASKKIIFDRDGKEIKWSYIEQLVEYGKSRDFNLMHKLNQKHIQWFRNKMKVDLAVQTLSESTAGSLECLMNKGENGFRSAAATIRFNRIFDKLFDVLNTKYDNQHEENIYKRALGPANRIEIFALLEEAIDYIEGLQIIEKTDCNKKLSILQSKSKTGFSGYISNMRVLKSIYQEYVAEKQLLTNIKMYRLNQDPLEIFFGRCRALNGRNDNPTVEQFYAAFRKLIVFDTLLCSKYSNCSENDIPNQPIGNILYVTSKSSTKSSTEDDNVSPAEIETLLQKIAEVEAMENNCLMDSLQDYTIAFVAGQIESRIQDNDRMYCQYCKNIFKENLVMQNVYIGSKLKKKPCKSTFEICKIADKFLKLRLLSDSIDFTLIYAGISSYLDLSNLYPETDFSHDFDHKLFFVKTIVNVYVQIRGTSLAKSITFNTHQSSIRTKMRKLVHFSGQ